MDDLALYEFKNAQREGWASFAPLEAITTPPAAKLVSCARVQLGQKVLDVGCGTGVVAVTAARRGALASGLDLSPDLLEHARENARIAGVSIEFREGDAEGLPYEDASFDVVLSQFGHMFAPRPDLAVHEMLRVLRPGGTIAFSTWPPELYTGRMFALTARFSPPLPEGVPAPVLWGDPSVVRARLGDAVRDLTFDRGTMLAQALSPAHHRHATERHAGPVRKLVATAEASVLAQFRKEYEALAAEYFDGNVVRQDFLLTRATKI